MTSYNDKRIQLEERMISFSVSVIELCSPHSKAFALRSLIDQVIRSSTSVGANYTEANNSSSRADFKNKIFISKKEIAETRYWLRVLKEFIPDDLSGLEKEAKELNLILQKIISTMKLDESNGKGKKQ